MLFCLRPNWKVEQDLAKDRIPEAALLAVFNRQFCITLVTHASHGHPYMLVCRSGKTYSMFGKENSVDPSTRGIIPHSVFEIFKVCDLGRSRSLQKQAGFISTFTCCLTFCALDRQQMVCCKSLPRPAHFINAWASWSQAAAGCGGKTA